MKKAYAKPQIMFEDFSLSTSIAVGCEYESYNNAGEGVCGYYDVGENATIFVTSGVGGCVFGAPDKLWGTDDYNTVCYDIPSQSYNLYTSH